MDWAEVIAHPSLRDLPFRIETNGFGQIVMSPLSNHHGLVQSVVARRISELKTSGQLQFQCAIETDDGVKVADVAWYSTKFFQTHRRESAYTLAPELCIEVLLPTDSLELIEEKSRLYFLFGAHEVWICNEDGTMRFANQSGELLRSELFPDFPARIEIE